MGSNFLSLERKYGIKCSLSTDIDGICQNSELFTELQEIIYKYYSSSKVIHHCAIVMLCEWKQKVMSVYQVKIQVCSDFINLRIRRLSGTSYTFTLEVVSGT